MPVDARTLQPYGLLHGGASVLLAETLGSSAGMLCVARRRGRVGIEINANHLRGVRDGLVTGTARPAARRPPDAGLGNPHRGRTRQAGVRLAADAGGDPASRRGETHAVNASHTLRFALRTAAAAVALLVDLPLTLLLIARRCAGIDVARRDARPPRDPHLAGRADAHLRLPRASPRRAAWRARRCSSPTTSAGSTSSRLHSQRMMGFVAKREISRWPLVGWLATRGETIYHERGSSESLGGVLHEMLARLRAGRRSACSRKAAPATGARSARSTRASSWPRSKPACACSRWRCATGAARARRRWSRSGRAKASRQLPAPAGRAGARGRSLVPRTDRRHRCRRPPPHRRTGARAHRRRDGGALNRMSRS